LSAILIIKEKDMFDEFVLNNSLQPMQQDNDQIGVVSDIFSLEDVF